jgi:hypothetical protein
MNQTFECESLVVVVDESIVDLINPPFATELVGQGIS